MEADELLDLINKNNEVVGTVMREEHHANVARYNALGQYWRGVAAFVINEKNEIWVPRRQPWRKVAGGGLDFSMAEHVKSGESHLEGAVRGMEEELNIQVADDELELVIEHLFEDFGCLMCIYLYRSNTTPNYNTDDYQSAEWLSIDDLIRQLKQTDQKYKSGLPVALEKLKQLV